ncbi:nuclear fragile X mental retardation-interacting protein 1 [Ophiocordyceps camponoti-floridani]|uniref:Nuclear fragile X mental retardation-interacting protein 1 n=1 Tax=Ophiocordyceps camponoti-floridani TaxID=2030778 RepID=A0A8H4Q379_9HYPO|nr:nuclear fragile X mental retardation-interacting protein 1 [Ophiocordyceps camponoti-floridani]
MAGYGYGPPPPPPLPSSYGQSTSSYGYHGHHRGGGVSGGRGRGGQYSRGRGDFHAAPAPPLHYEYGAQPYSYPVSQPPTVTYPPHPQQWTPEHFSPQPPYGPPQQYGNPYHAPAAPQHWSALGSAQQGHYGRGARSGPKPPHKGYEHESPAPVGVGYVQPYSHDPRTPHYPPAHYAYPGPPPPPAHGHHEASHGQYHRRSRGGGYRDGARGRGGYHNNNGYSGGDKARHQQRQATAPEVKVKTESPSLGKKKKRKTNTLGLTPGMDSESEDDEGEEKALLDLIGPETLQITDVAAFLAERRKNYPTKERVEAKKAAELARREADKAALLEKQADRLRRQLRRVESSIKRKREQGDEGDEMRDSSEEPSDDEKPEVMSSRLETAATPDASAKKADVSRHCKYYSTGGTCGKKGKCRFVHDPEVREAAIKEREANDGRMTIQQRLILNDKEQEDLTILQSIQYLREKGLMKPAPQAQTSSDKNKADKSRVLRAERPQKPVAAVSSLLPAAPASLPDPPIKREAGSGRRNAPSSAASSGLEHYQGWLLQPYGSTDGKQAMTDDLP